MPQDKTNPYQETTTPYGDKAKPKQMTPKPSAPKTAAPKTAAPNKRIPRSTLKGAQAVGTQRTDLYDSKTGKIVQRGKTKPLYAKPITESQFKYSSPDKTTATRQRELDIARAESKRRAKMEVENSLKWNKRSNEASAPVRQAKQEQDQILKNPKSRFDTELDKSNILRKGVVGVYDFITGNSPTKRKEAEIEEGQRKIKVAEGRSKDYQNDPAYTTDVNARESELMNKATSDIYRRYPSNYGNPKRVTPKKKK